MTIPMLLALVLSIYYAVVSGLPLERGSQDVQMSSYTSIVAFGDSFTDNGNGSYRVSNGTWPANPAYYQGRFSNGLTWVEHVASNLSIPLYDHAIGGSTSSNALVQGYTGPSSSIPVASLDEQVMAFLTSGQQPSGFSISSSLFVLFTGANDIFFNPNISGLQSASVISTSVSRLQNAGARSFLLLGYPDLSLIPYDSYVNSTTTKQQLRIYSSDLVEALEQLSSVITGSLTVNLDVLFRDFYFYGEPRRYGFDAYGAYGSCLTGAYAETANVTLCNDADQRVFWDEYHPTRLSHAVVAGYVLSLLDYM